MNDKQQITCSIVIPTHNRCDVLVQCLDSISKQTRSLDDIEFIVCDDGSSDGTEQAVKEWVGPFSPIYLRNEAPKGPGSARNMAFQVTRGEYILYLNDDAILTPHCLELHLSYHKLYHNKKIAVVGTFKLPEKYERTLFGYIINRSDLSFRYPVMESKSIYGSSAFYTCNISVKKEAHIESGLFDEDFRVGADDIEMGYRMQKNGYGVLYIKNCLAYHEHKLDPEGFSRAQIGRGAGGVIHFTKHSELTCHYDKITESDVERLKVDLNKISPAVKKIISLIGKLEEQYTIEPEEMDNTLRKHSKTEEIIFPRVSLNISVNQMIWKRDFYEIREYSNLIISALQSFCKERGKAVPELIDVVCASAYFLKWYYDTVGIVDSPWIHKFIEKKAIKN